MYSLNTNATILYKSLQLVAYANDIYLLVRTQLTVKEAMTHIEEAAKDLDLIINFCNTKIMTQTRRNAQVRQNLIIRAFEFENVIDCTSYLGTNLSRDENATNEIKKLIMIIMNN